ncbi:MAG: hypothetical protein WAU07_03175 [Microgenomates group bacterium]
MSEQSHKIKLYGDTGIFIARLIEMKDPSIERHEVEQVLQYTMMAIKEVDEVLDATPTPEERSQIALLLIDQLFTDAEIDASQKSFPFLFLKYYTASFSLDTLSKIRSKAKLLFQATELVKSSPSVLEFVQSTLHEGYATIDFLISIVESDIDQREIMHIKEWLILVAQAANIFDSLVDIEEDRKNNQNNHHSRLSLAAALTATFVLKSLTVLPKMPKGVITKIAKHVVRDFKKM